MNRTPIEGESILSFCRRLYLVKFRAESNRAVYRTNTRTIAKSTEDLVLRAATTMTTTKRNLRSEKLKRSSTVSETLYTPSFSTGVPRLIKRRQVCTISNVKQVNNKSLRTWNLGDISSGDLYFQGWRTRLSLSLFPFNPLFDSSWKGKIDRKDRTCRGTRKWKID